MSLEDYLDNQAKYIGITWCIQTSVRHGATYQEAFNFAHAHHHAMQTVIGPEDRDLDCEICSGLPPWEWSEYGGEFVENEPIEESHIEEEIAGGYFEGYPIRYLAHNWRTPRIFKRTDDRFGKCKMCGSMAYLSQPEIFTREKKIKINGKNTLVDRTDVVRCHLRGIGKKDTQREAWKYIEDFDDVRFDKYLRKVFVCEKCWVARQSVIESMFNLYSLQKELEITKEKANEAKAKHNRSDAGVAVGVNA